MDPGATAITHISRISEVLLSGITDHRSTAADPPTRSVASHDRDAIITTRRHVTVRALLAPLFVLAKLVPVSFLHLPKYYRQQETF